MESPHSLSDNNLLQTLTSRGWCFGDINQVKSLIAVQSSYTVDSIESELANIDLRSIGGKSLPDFSLLRKSSHLQGPKVLQISSVRDISRSTMAESSGSSNNRRLLRLKLTDGHTEITAIEYSPLPSIPVDVVPGTKVRLENKVAVHSGVVCLNAKVVTVLGGTVTSLYEEWEMNRKYSSFSRSTLKQTHDDGTVGPPPFEKLQIGASSKNFSQHKRYSEEAQSSKASQMHSLRNDDSRIESAGRELKPPANVERNEEKPSSSALRPKEVAEAVPVQNQAAAQKLLQKMSQPPGHDGHRSRGQRHGGRGRGREEEQRVFTLDEWERRKAGANLSSAHDFPDISHDEDLARQLQQQLDLEDSHVRIYGLPHSNACGIPPRIRFQLNLSTGRT